MIDAGQLLSKEFWLARAPGFHIADAAFFRSSKALRLSPSEYPGIGARLSQDGYFQGAGIDWGLDIARLAAAVEALSADDLSPAFAFLYDEFWLPFHQLHAYFTFVLGGAYYLLPDFWVWNVRPGEAGWKPHRDKGRMALFDNGLPKSVTTWIALSEATPLNSCIYLVPAQFDPTYGTPNEATWQFEQSAVRALPSKPGDFFMWNQAVVHWGSRSSAFATSPRISMALEAQRADVAPFNEPLIKPLVLLPFEFRLKLIAKQLLQYKHMYPLDAATEALGLDLAKIPLVTP